MTTDWIHDRGRGPEIVGTRLTVYNLLPDFLDASKTEADLCRIYHLSPEQTAAARAYVLNHFESVVVENRRIEERIAEGNPPDIAERMKATRVAFLKRKAEIEARASSTVEERRSERESPSPSVS